jgi:hypothetical protein
VKQAENRLSSKESFGSEAVHVLHKASMVTLEIDVQMLNRDNQWWGKCVM